jgi:hypothetical protein
VVANDDLAVGSNAADAAKDVPNCLDGVVDVEVNVDNDRSGSHHKVVKPKPPLPLRVGNSQPAVEGEHERERVVLTHMSDV